MGASSDAAALHLQAGGLGQWQFGFASLFTLAANCPRLKELTISEEQLVVSCPALVCSGALPCGWQLLSACCSKALPCDSSPQRSARSSSGPSASSPSQLHEAA